MNCPSARSSRASAPGEHDEACPGELGGGREIHQPECLAEFEMLAWGEVECGRFADLLEHDVRALVRPVRHVGVEDVGQRLQNVSQRRFGLSAPLLVCGDLVTNHPCALFQGRSALAFPGAGHRSACRVRCVPVADPGPLPPPNGARRRAAVCRQQRASDRASSSRHRTPPDRRGSRGCRASAARRETRPGAPPLDQGEIVRRTQDTHTPPRVEHEKVVIAADDGLCSGRQSKLQVFVILRVTAVSDAHRSLEPHGLTAQDFQDPFTSLTPNCLRDLDG